MSVGRNSYQLISLARLALLFFLPVVGCASARDTIHQVSTLNALQESVYDGVVTLGELKRHGNLGIGTFDALDGELILLDGAIYRFRADGHITVPRDDERTPFAAVTWFEADRTMALEPGTTFERFKSGVDAALSTLNLPYAIRVQGVFASMRTRAPRRQSPPYSRLVDAIADQPEFEYRESRGTLVGFRLPSYLGGVNVPGWHLHYISDDRTEGGHVLAFVVAAATLEIDVSPELRLSLPVNGAFVQRDLSRDATHEVESIEGSRAGGR